MEINKSHFGTMTNIIIDAAYALRSRFHLPLLHINLRLIFWQQWRESSEVISGLIMRYSM